MNDVKIFASIIDEATKKQIEDTANSEAYKGCPIRIMPDCLVENTEVLTSDGFKYIKDLKGEEMVANYQKEDGSVFFARVHNVIVRDMRHGEKVYKLSNNRPYFEMMSSENHRNLINGEVVLTKDIQEQTKAREFVYNANGIKAKKINVSDDFLRLLVWVVGDGSLKKNPCSDNYRIQFGLKKERKIERVTNILESLQYKYHKSKSLKQTTICVCTIDAMKVYNYLNGVKEFPKEFLYLNIHQAEVFKEELIQVDGDYEAYKRYGTYRYNTQNEHDADMVQAIFSINFGLSRKVKRNCYSSFIKRKRDIYYITLVDMKGCPRDGHTSTVISKEEVSYNGKLCCIECDSSFFIARQNSITFVTGNCHAGSGCTIGSVISVKDRIVPSTVGVDISCGMLVVDLGKQDIDLRELDKVINERIPSSFNLHDTPVEEFYINNFHCREALDEDIVQRSIGTLGGGNHFIELDVDGNGDKYLVIHSGSRNLGKRVCDYWQKKAYECCMIREGIDLKYEEQAIIERLKSQGREREINDAIKELHAKNKLKVTTKDLAYLEGKYKARYLNDMRLCEMYANLNRATMADIICEAMGLNDYGRFTTLHNYIDIDYNILRKGAVRARNGEKLIIPMNMRDGSLLCEGKGNIEWLYSAPHGAGRIMSRKQAKEKLDLHDFEKSMEGIYTTSVCKETIDEAPMVYKPMSEIIECIEPTVRVIAVLKPLYNFKAKTQEDERFIK